ncbi:hypothetical protein CsSME_00013456 [Camellia sinensis var. sinensis]
MCRLPYVHLSSPLQAAVGVVQKVNLNFLSSIFHFLDGI